MVSNQVSGLSNGQLSHEVSHEVSDQFGGLRALFADGFFPRDCPTRTVLDHVTSRWGILVLLTLSGRTLRWGELRRAIEGVSEKMLAQTLRTLEQDGLVHREALLVIPPHVEYSLTGLGDDLVTHLAPLVAWIARHADEIVTRATPSTP
ncbi:helix-turn-helix transcriptional regulator [Frankia sp. Mgl5]|uniref:winged helix-turn-helix transcriptional regulator n=1 Tax=Frankia sp. Mgl5 TaxID=2933793 RepID=UPI00200E82AB|nr:helix-turn-helix domain-containing protein [Frankia sp. Mgl5]MCK9932709.1 helix-turn-helix transcriptional regulator [Frankia sp. Mgl5]